MSSSEQDEIIPFLSGTNVEKLLNGYYTPTTDIKETKEYLIVEIELAGVHPDSITMEIGGGTLDIRGERNEEKIHRSHSIKYKRKERIYGKFKKCIPIHSSVSSNKVRANFKNGLLTIEIPKPKEQDNTKKQKIRLL